MTWLRNTLAFALFLFAVGCCVGHAAGCKPPQTIEQAAAEGAYGAALLRCVDEATTLQESKACRERVDREWGITQIGKDGGR